MALEKLALIGARGHFNLPLRVLPQMPQIRVVGVSDGGPDDPATPLLKWCSEHGQDPKKFDDYRQMLDATKPDAVVVCGPFELHAQMSVDAIERGVHVFVEKPVALTINDLERVRVAHQKHLNVHIAGMMASRYDPGFLTAWNLIRQGAIGDGLLLNARKSYKLGKRSSYYHDRATYGGTIPWVGSHAIDWVLWMSSGEVNAISALHSSECNEGNGTMERSAACLLTLNGGRMATVSIDVFRPGNAPTHGDDWIRIVGTKGVIEARPNSVSVINETNDGTQPAAVLSDRDVFKEFVDHIDGKRPAMINAQQTLVLAEVCLLARQSADEGGATMRIPEGRRLKFE